MPTVQTKNGSILRLLFLYSHGDVRFPTVRDDAHLFQIRWWSSMFAATTITQDAAHRVHLCPHLDLQLKLRFLSELDHDQLLNRHGEAEGFQYKFAGSHDGITASVVRISSFGTQLHHAGYNV